MLALKNQAYGYFKCYLVVGLIKGFNLW